MGGVTAYNSYIDKDEGPIGGLKNPPKMAFWMLIASWVLQIVGFVVGFLSGGNFSLVYLVSVVAFWMYSSPHVRLKGRPIGSFFAIAVATVICSCLLGYYSNGSVSWPSAAVLYAALGSVCLIISLYPFSQTYQVEEDKKRGDTTFSVRFGKRGVIRLFLVLFPIGIILISYALISINILFGLTSILGGIIAGPLSYSVARKLTMTREDYKNVMRIKYSGGMIFSLFTLLLILLRLYW